jgi:hypothetical protein
VAEADERVAERRVQTCAEALRIALSADGQIPDRGSARLSRMDAVFLPEETRWSFRLVDQWHVYRVHVTGTGGYFVNKRFKDAGGEPLSWEQLPPASQACNETLIQEARSAVAKDGLDHPQLAVVRHRVDQDARTGRSQHIVEAIFESGDGSESRVASFSDGKLAGVGEANLAIVPAAAYPRSSGDGRTVGSAQQLWYPVVDALPSPNP